MQLTDEEKKDLQEKIDQELAARKDRYKTKWVMVGGIFLLCAIAAFAIAKSETLQTLMEIIGWIARFL